MIVRVLHFGSKRAILPVAIIALLVAAGVAPARVTMVVFPFAELTVPSPAAYIGAVIPEHLDRCARAVAFLEVWDPVLTMNEDSSAWRMNADSLLETHRKRWGWDAAVGGSFRAVNDSVYIRVKLVRYQNLRAVRAAYAVSGTNVLALRDSITAFVFAELGIRASGPDSLAFLANISSVPNAWETYCAGYGFELMGQFTQALSAYRHAVALDKRLSQAWVRMAGLSLKTRDVKRAQESIARATEAAQNDPVVLGQIALFKVDNESPGAAQQFIDNTSAVLNRTAGGLTAIGKLFVVQGFYQRGVATLARALAFGPGNLDAEWALAQANLESGQFDAATESLNRLIAFRPGFIPFYATQGTAYRRSGKLMESVWILEAALRIEPDNIAVLMNLSQTYFELLWYERALQLLNRARELQPELPEITINLGVLNWHMGKHREALAFFEEALRERANPQTIFNNRGTIYASRGNLGRAIKEFERADKSGRKNETILYNLGQAYLQKDDLKKAAFWFEELLRIAPGRIDVLLYQAEITKSLGDTPQAELYYRKMLDLAPYNAEVLKGLITVLEQQKKYDQAVEVLDFYLQSFPTDIELRMRLGKTYRIMGWPEVALQQYEMLIRDFPRHSAGYLGLGETLYEMVEKKGSKLYKRTLENLSRAKELDPSLVEPDYFAGLLYLDHLQDKAKAQLHLSRALSLATERPMRALVLTALKRVNK